MYRFWRDTGYGISVLLIGLVQAVPLRPASGLRPQHGPLGPARGPRDPSPYQPCEWLGIAIDESIIRNRGMPSSAYPYARRLSGCFDSQVT